MLESGSRARKATEFVSGQAKVARVLVFLERFWRQTWRFSASSHLMWRLLLPCYAVLRGRSDPPPGARLTFWEHRRGTWRLSGDCRLDDFIAKGFDMKPDDGPSARSSS